MVVSGIHVTHVMAEQFTASYFNVYAVDVNKKYVRIGLHSSYIAFQQLAHLIQGKEYK